jgi:hypothetical protein
MKKAALFTFKDDPMCFIHVLLNALDMKQRGYETTVILEGAATRLATVIPKTDHPLHGLWEKVRNTCVLGACEACSRKMEVFEDVKNQGLTIFNEMNGHPAIGRFMDEGFEILIF